mmetsp:Transcript_39960/g.112960  ORF Transcript_39960/g.112960 Transcript_39960/m.112960 type:complete len:275 (-) Transcript_39960:17-841(-)
MHQLDPPVNVLLLAVTELVLQEVIEHLEAFDLHLFVRIERTAFLLVDVACRAYPVGGLVHNEHVLAAPDERGEDDPDAGLLPGACSQLEVARQLRFLLRVEGAATEARRQQASLAQLDRVVGGALHATVGARVLRHVEGLKLGAAVALQLVGVGAADDILVVFVPAVEHVLGFTVVALLLLGVFVDLVLIVVVIGLVVLLLLVLLILGVRVLTLRRATASPPLVAGLRIGTAPGEEGEEEGAEIEHGHAGATHGAATGAAGCMAAPSSGSAAMA